MNYEPNDKRWEPGDFVLHDRDNKNADMLMRVEGYDADGLCMTRYCTPNTRNGRYRGVFANPPSVLHDPARFGVETPKANRPAVEAGEGALKKSKTTPGAACTWTEDDGVWHTSCSNAFLFEHLGPDDNGFCFCPYCGKPLAETARETQTEIDAL